MCIITVTSNRKQKDFFRTKLLFWFSIYERGCIGRQPHQQAASPIINKYLIYVTPKPKRVKPCEAGGTAQSSQRGMIRRASLVAGEAIVTELY